MGKARADSLGEFIERARPDLVVSNVDAPPTLLRSDSAHRGSRLLVDAPGALRVTVEHGERRQVRGAVRGGSYVPVSAASTSGSGRSRAWNE